MAIPARDAAANVRYQRDLHPRSPVGMVSAPALYLASEGCAISGQMISAAGGRYARLARFMNPGWLAPTI